MTEVAESARPPRRFRRYPEYKSSGMAWLGDLPSHWKPKRFKFACSRSALYGANESAESYSLDGIRFLRTTDIDDSGSLVDDGAVYLPEELVQDYLLSDGDILISRSGTLGRALHYQRDVHGPCAYAGYLVRFVPKPTLDPRFAFYFTKSKVFMGWLSVSAIQSTIGNINGQKYGNLHLPDPALGEQRAIADFLDRETARIDQLIEKKQRMVEVLRESLASVVKRMTTPHAENDAQLIPFRWICRVAEGQVDPTDPDWAQAPLIAPNHIQSGTGRILAFGTAEDQGAISGKYSYPAGTVLYSKIRPALAKACIAPQAGLCSADMYPILTDNKLIPEFLLMQLLSRRFTDWATLESMRVAMPKINREALGGYRFWVPCLKIQKRLISQFTTDRMKIEQTTDAVTISIDRLHEFRSALITAAVTGQIDVSTWGKKGTADRRFDRIEEATSA